MSLYGIIRPQQVLVNFTHLWEYIEFSTCLGLAQPCYNAAVMADNPRSEWSHLVISSRHPGPLCYPMQLSGTKEKHPEYWQDQTTFYQHIEAEIKWLIYWDHILELYLSTHLGLAQPCYNAAVMADSPWSEWSHLVISPGHPGPLCCSIQLYGTKERRPQYWQDQTTFYQHIEVLRLRQSGCHFPD